MENEEDLNPEIKDGSLLKSLFPTGNFYLIQSTTHIHLQ
jgi:hypothetical protein